MGQGEALKEKSTPSTSLCDLWNLNGSNTDTTAIVTSGIVFIDPKVDDYEMLMAGVKPGLEVVLLDGSLHIVAHGETVGLGLGNGLVNSNTLDQQSHDLQSWAAALAVDADILLYGCNVANGLEDLVGVVQDTSIPGTSSTFIFFTY